MKKNIILSENVKEQGLSDIVGNEKNETENLAQKLNYLRINTSRIPVLPQSLIKTWARKYLLRKK